MRAILASVLLLLSAACASVPGQDEPGTPNLCADLGWAFYVIASLAELGHTQNDQFLCANKELHNAKTRQTALRIISYAYSDEGVPLDLGLDVIHACKIEGQTAVVSLCTSSE